MEESIALVKVIIAPIATETDDTDHEENEMMDVLGHGSALIRLYYIGPGTTWANEMNLL